MPNPPRVHVVDFETYKIEPRPAYPPEPVSVAVKLAHEPRPRFLSWGHPTENNTTRAEAIDFLARLWRDPTPKLFYHAKFDLAVAHERLGLPLPPWEQVHDAMFLAFLNNPHATRLDLKSLAAELLNQPPDEQEQLHNWIRTHVFTSLKGGEGSVVLTDGRKPEGFFKVPPTKAGAFIAHAPGKLVGKYAKGDVTRTLAVFKKLYPDIEKRSMVEAYNRERRLLPVLHRSEQTGVQVRNRKLAKDTALWEGSIEEVDRFIRRRLKAPDLNIDSGEDLADAIEAAGKVDEWILTDTGNRSTSKENLTECLTDRTLIDVLAYRGLLVNSLRNFSRPWLAMAERSGGLIYTSWNSTRSTENGKGRGARTGRLSSTPNFQNVAKTPPVIHTTWRERQLAIAAGEKALYLPPALAKKVCDLPKMRSYIGPRKGYTMLNRDYSQQELRILGHFEDGILLDAYQEDPTLDLHDLAKSMINDTLGTNFSRKPIKNMGFGLIYGMGVAKLAAAMGVDVATARTIKKAYLNIFPGLRELIDELQSLGKANDALKTWGGREYYVEPPRFSKQLRKLLTFEYKLLNVLIQGSAADITKEAVIRVNEALSDESNILLTVHDELMAESPTGIARTEMAKMREAMESVELDVPLLSDGKWGRTSWAGLRTFKEPSWRKLHA